MERLLLNWNCLHNIKVRVVNNLLVKVKANNLWPGKPIPNKHTFPNVITNNLVICSQTPLFRFNLYIFCQFWYVLWIFNMYVYNLHVTPLNFESIMAFFMSVTKQRVFRLSRMASFVFHYDYYVSLFYFNYSG